MAADDRVSNSDLASEEMEAGAAFVGGGEEDAPGAEGLEAVLTPPAVRTRSATVEAPARQTTSWQFIMRSGRSSKNEAKSDLTSHSW